jgi:hypothetical protein
MLLDRYQGHPSLSSKSEIGLDARLTTRESRLASVALIITYAHDLGVCEEQLCLQLAVRDRLRSLDSAFVPFREP